MTDSEFKYAKVLAWLNRKGWIDGKIIQKLTNTTSVRDYICDLKRRKGIKIVPHHITPTYTRWLLASRPKY